MVQNRKIIRFCTWNTFLCKRYAIFYENDLKICKKAVIVKSVAL